MQQQSDRYQALGMLILVFLAVVGATVWYVRTPAGEPLIVALPTPGATESADSASEVKVYITGAVLRPGVYSVTRESRLEDLVQAAGGLTIDADREKINLASVLRDGQHIHVPTFRDTLTSATVNGTTANSGTAAKVNINTASAAELEDLPRIGTVTASKIIAYRDANGPFTTIEDLRDLKLLRDADFEQVKDLISAE